VTPRNHHHRDGSLLLASVAEINSCLLLLLTLKFSLHCGAAHGTPPVTDASGAPVTTVAGATPPTTAAGATPSTAAGVTPTTAAATPTTAAAAPTTAAK